MPDAMDVTTPEPSVRDEAEALLARLFSLQTDTTFVHVWRGQADSRWELLPTLYRRLLNRYLPDEVSEDLVQRYETDLLCEANGLGFYQSNRLATFVALQHHGGATRFLDVTRNVFVSLWFATETLPESPDGVVHHFSVPVDRVVRFDQISSFDDIADARHSGQPYVYFPRPDDERIKAQQAGFLATVLDRSLSAGNPFTVGKGGLQAEAIIVPGRIKNYIRTYLGQFVGLDTVGVYPDFAGYALANSSIAPFPREPHELNHGRDGLFPNREPRVGPEGAVAEFLGKTP